MKDDIDSDEYQMGAAGNAASRAQRDALNGPATSLVSASVASGFLRPHASFQEPVPALPTTSTKDAG